MSRDRERVKTLLSFLAVVAAVASAVAGLDLTGFISVMPPKAAAILVTVPPAAAALVHLANTARNALKANQAVPDVDVIRRTVESTVADNLRRGGLNLLLLGCSLAAISLPMASCVTATDPSGVTVQTVDRQAVTEIGNPILGLIRDLFLPPPAPAAPIVPAK